MYTLLFKKQYVQQPETQLNDQKKPKHINFTYIYHSYG